MMAGMSAGVIHILVILCRRCYVFVLMFMRCGRLGGDSLRGMGDRLLVAGVVMGHMRMMVMLFMSAVGFIWEEGAGFLNVLSGIDGMFVLSVIVFVHFIHSSDFRKYKTVSFTQRDTGTSLTLIIAEKDCYRLTVSFPWQLR